MENKIFLFSVLILFLVAQAIFGAEVLVRKEVGGGWRLFVDQNDFFVRGMEYRVTQIGESPDQGTLRDWAFYDENHNGVIDGPYEAWVDLNRNNRKEPEEPVPGDFQLMKQMGVNTIRWYMNDVKNQQPNQQLFRDLFHRYGIYVAIGNKFGAYTIDSGASWEEGTDYRDANQRRKMLQSIRRMVLDHKEEPYTLMWLLGNENNYRFTNTNAADYPAAYAAFVNEAAQLIHQLDGQHPVALVNGDVDLISYYQKYCPDVDIFGVNAYRGPNGFGTLWQEVKQAYDKPILIVEYGGAAAAEKGEEAQALYHRNAWLDILANRAGQIGAGNAVGGFAFSWLDEWWKAGDPHKQASPGAQGRVGKDLLNWSQEYCGLTTQGNGRHTPFQRQLRPVYFMYQKLWNN